MMKFAGIVALLLSTLCYGQKQMPEAEQKELQAALAETSNSPLEIARTLEKHLEKYPNSESRNEIERAIVKAAVEANDKPRILSFGERTLAANIEQPLVLERVAQILLEVEEKERAERALKYALKLEEMLRALEKEGPSSTRNRAQLLEELDRALGRALLLQSRAQGILGKTAEAILLAQRSWDFHPSAAAARESARWLALAGRNMEAVRRYAEAFTTNDPKNTAEARLEDRRKMAALYRKEKDTEAGLGDIVLEAYDRTSALDLKRAELQQTRDPNAQAKEPMDFTLTGLTGQPLKMSSLKGKVVVLDFWATWCGPCRVQQPLYEEVKKSFGTRDDLVFLNINTDEDQSVVKPFLDQNKWSKNVYFEDGLGSLLRVSSIPTTIILDRQGRIFSRMNGFVPERFVDQLTERIDEALRQETKSAASRGQ
jgi:thiol-disulfide isomerase/thioredoxin